MLSVVGFTMALILLLLFVIWGAICGLNLNLADETNDHDENKKRLVTSIHVQDTQNVFQSNCLIYGCPNKTSGHLDLHDNPHIVDIRDIAHSFPTPPPSAYFVNTMPI